MASAVYLMCALTSGVCALLLTRAYLARHHRFLLWSAICFTGLLVNNVLLFVDLVVVPTSADLSLWRGFTGLASLLVLLYGLVTDAR